MLVGALNRLGADRRDDAAWLADQVAAIVGNLKAMEASSRPLDPDYDLEELLAWLDDQQKTLATLVNAAVRAAPAAALLALEVATQGRPRPQ